MGRRHRSNSSPPGTHDIQDLENELLAAPRPSPPVALRPPVRVPRFTEDRRQWDPTDRGPLDTQGLPARSHISNRVSAKRPAAAGNRKSPRLYQARVFRDGHAFNAPRFVIICIRRKSRRQVIFAKKLHGKGGASRRHKYNQWSKFRC